MQDSMNKRAWKFATIALLCGSAHAAHAQGSDIASLWKGTPEPKSSLNTKSPKAAPKTDSTKHVAPKTAAPKATSASSDAPKHEQAKGEHAPQQLAVAAPRVEAVSIDTTVFQVPKFVAPKAEAPKPEPVKVAAPVAATEPPSTAALLATISALEKRLAELEAVKVRVDAVEVAQKSAKVAAAEAEARTAKAISGLGNFRFSGDVRVRYEGQFQSGGFVTRNRERSRARLNISGSLTDDITATIGIATGAFDDVQSANQTQTGFFSRKSLGFDKFFIAWTPKDFYGFSVKAGKFPYTWDRTSLTWGNDINPEGVSAAWNVTPGRVFSGFSVTAYALPFLEVAGGADSYHAGAQAQAKWKFGSAANARLSLGQAHFQGADAIAQAIQAGTIKPASANTNRVRLDATGKTIIGYQSEFTYREVLGNVEFSPAGHWPLAITVNAVQNPSAKAGEQYGYWSEAKFGRLSKPGDLQSTYSFFRIERDAVVGAFNEQDLRAATNVVNHRVGFSWAWRSNATFGATAYLGRLLDPKATPSLATPFYKSACSATPATSACTDPWLSRVQFDMSYKF